VSEPTKTGCFGAGKDYVPGCQCRQIFYQRQYAAFYKQMVTDITAEPLAKLEEFMKTTGFENPNMRVEAKLGEIWTKL
jgi:hypothetical protein